MALAKAGESLKDSQGNDYIIIEFLGEGVTAEVYKARRTDGEFAALKILRPQLPREIVQSFRDEAVILGELAQYSQRRYSGEPIHVPRMLGRTREEASPEFLALEYVVGEPLDDLIVATGGLASLDRELEALQIAMQVLQVLIVLHEDIRRSYIDFQLKNIWWIREQALVKVMDWNHVSKRVDEGEVVPGQADDLVRFGAYLYQLLTGKGALQTGETEGSLAHRAGENWEKISLGTRSILGKALHLNPQNRYQTARDFKDAVEEMIHLWTQDLDLLYDEAATAVRSAKKLSVKNGGTAAPEKYMEANFVASRAIDLYTRRSEEKGIVERLQNELIALTDGVSPQWGAGRSYYKAGVYSEAQRLWQPEAQNLERLDLWRWVVLTRIAQEGKQDYAAIQYSLEKSVACLNQGDWDEARAYLKSDSRQSVNNDDVSLLSYEVDVWESIEEAGRSVEVENWIGAGEAYTKAVDALENVHDETYRRLLIEQVGDEESLTQKAEHYYERQEISVDEGKRVNKFLVLLRQEKWEVLYRWLKEQLIIEPDQPSLLTKIATEAQEFPLDKQISLLSVAEFYGQPNQFVKRNLVKAWQQRREREREGEVARYTKALEEEKAAKQAAEEKIYKQQLVDLSDELDKALSHNDWQKLQVVASDMGGLVSEEHKKQIEDLFNQSWEQQDWNAILYLGAALSAITVEEDEKNQIRQQVEQARQLQDIDFDLVTIDKYLQAKHFSEAREAIDAVKTKIVNITDGANRESVDAKLAEREEQLDRLSREIVRNVDGDSILEQLKNRDLQGLAMGIEDKIESIEQKASRLAEQNDTITNDIKGLKKNIRQEARGGRSSLDLPLVLLLSIVAFAAMMVIGGYWIRTENFEPLATQVAALKPTVESGDGPLAVTSTPTPIFSPSPTTTSPPTATPIPNTPTPLPPTPTPLPEFEFSVTSNYTDSTDSGLPSIDDLTPTAGEFVEEGSNLSTHYSWPDFEITVGNGWQFEIQEGGPVKLINEAVAFERYLTLQISESLVVSQVNNISTSPVISLALGEEALNMEAADANENSQSSIVVSGKYIRNLLREEGIYLLEFFSRAEEADDWQQLALVSQELNDPLSIELAENALLEAPGWENGEPYTGPVHVIGLLCNPRSDWLTGSGGNGNEQGDYYFHLAVEKFEEPGVVYWLRNSRYENYTTLETTPLQSLIEEFSEFERCIEEAQQIKDGTG